MPQQRDGRRTPTKRQQEILGLIDEGYTSVPEIASRMRPPVSRNAVYDHGKRMRRDGLLPPNFTFGGEPMREKRPGADVIAEVMGIHPDYSTRLEEQEVRQVLSEALRRTRDDLESIIRYLNRLLPH